MSYQEILYDVDGHVATITLNCPERMNSFSDTLLTEWADAITRSAQDDGVRAVIITGTGRAFCAGANLKARAEEDKVLRTDSSPAERRNGLRFTVHQVARALHLLDKPYIAAVNGAAVGAGMDMCSMADIRIASDKARFSMSYVNVGLIPGDGGAWLLPRLVGLQKALELLWSGELFGAEKAWRSATSRRWSPTTASWTRPAPTPRNSPRGRPSPCSSRSAWSTAALPPPSLRPWTRPKPP